LPPGDPGGGITGVVALPFRGGVTVIPGSTFGGVIVPFCFDSVSLRLWSGGATFSGGVVWVFGGATGGTGLDRGAAGGVCADAGAATITGSVAINNPVKLSARSIMGSCLFRPPLQRATARAVPDFPGPL
jgi:hypothetical protein